MRLSGASIVGKAFVGREGRRGCSGRVGTPDEGIASGRVRCRPMILWCGKQGEERGGFGGGGETGCVSLS